ARATPTLTWRGDGGKNTKPTISAPASNAAPSASDVRRPQILTTSGFAAVDEVAREWAEEEDIAPSVLTARFYMVNGALSRLGPMWNLRRRRAPRIRAKGAGPTRPRPRARCAPPLASSALGRLLGRPTWEACLGPQAAVRASSFVQ